jgi:pyridoxamine 5'-phosphate oxidase-like protein
MRSLSSIGGIFTVPTWGEFEAAAPDLAAAGRRLIYSRGDGEALLATVRSDGVPRIHPINVGIIGEHLYAFIIASSPKRVDLETDGRYALHAHVDPAAPSEFSLRGRARLVDAEVVRSAVAAQWYFTVDETYRLFELAVAAALHGDRPTADDWPPRYTSWRGHE